jgi:tetratricopeptide (TPR) repeat protein
MPNLPFGLSVRMVVHAAHSIFVFIFFLTQTHRSSFLLLLSLNIYWVPTIFSPLFFLSTHSNMSETKEADYKAQGNEAYKAKNYELAIEHYSKAIAAAPQSDTAALCLCNRAICHGVLKDWVQSADDAQRCVGIKPDWVKGYQRLGIALRKQGKHFEAVQALEKGTKANPDSADLKKTLDDAKAKLAKQLSGGTSGMESSNRGSFGKDAQKAMDSIREDFRQQQRRQRQLKSQVKKMLSLTFVCYY